jgi:ribosomal protein S27AE
MIYNRRKDYPFMDEIREDYQLLIKNGEINNHTKIPFKCKKHGEYWQTLNVHNSNRSKHMCPKCSKIRQSVEHRRTDYPFIDEIRPDYQEKIRNSEITSRDKVPFWCDIHKEYYWQSLNNHKSKNQGCPECGKIKQGINRRRKEYPFMEEIRKDYREKIVNGEIKTHDKIPFICEKHGEYWQKLTNHNSNHNKCPKCVKKVSDAEIEVYNFIKEYYPNTMNHVRNLIFSNKKLELDIYISELKIGIEYNGLIWHSTKFSKSKFNLLNKTKKFANIGIHVIHILENEWLYEKELTKQKLLYILGGNQNIDKFNELFKFDIIDNYVYADLKWIPLNNNIYDINNYKRKSMVGPKCFYVNSSTNKYIYDLFIDNKYYEFYDCGYIKYII